MVLSFDEFKHRLEEEGRKIGADERRTFDWLVERQRLSTEDCVQVLNLFLEQADFNSSSFERKRVVQK